MKLTFLSVAFTLLIVSAALNVGLISGYVRIASPETHVQTAYTDAQRGLMDALVEESQ
jgi:hypothetical protein